MVFEGLVITVLKDFGITGLLASAGILGYFKVKKDIQEVKVDVSQVGEVSLKTKIIEDEIMKDIKEIKDGQDRIHARIDNIHDKLSRK